MIILLITLLKRTHLFIKFKHKKHQMCFSDEFYPICAKYNLTCNLNLTCSFTWWTQGGWHRAYTAGWLCTMTVHIFVSAKLFIGCSVYVLVSVFSPLRHLQARHLGWLVSVSPGDFGRLSAVRRDGVGNDDSVMWGNHSAVPGHRDGCQYVVTCNANTSTVFTLVLWLAATLTVFIYYSLACQKWL